MKNAEAVAESTSNEMTGDPTDAVVELLMGDEAKNEDEETEDSGAEETLDEESTESDESDEAGDESEDEASLEDIADGDPTWKDVLGIDEEKLSFDEAGNVAGVQVKVNGETSTVAMTDLVAGYQLNKSVTQKSQALSEEKKTFDQQKEQVAKQYSQKLTEVSQLSAYLEKQLVAEYEGIDWESLRVQNPGEHAALKQEYAIRAQAMKQIRETNNQAMSEAQVEQQTKQAESTKAYVHEQAGKMIENNPTWSDEKVFAKEMGDLRKFCSDQYGFTEADFALVRDARLIELVKDANKYNAGVGIAKAKMKKPVPKFQKSKGGGRKKASKLATLTKAAQNATGAQKRDLQTDAVVELLSGGQ